jgi:hypothetical protein
MYRLYIDETGNADLRSSSERFLSLTGIIINKSHAGASLYPRLEEIKRVHLDSHPDDPVVLHRKDIIAGKGPFGVLKDPERRAAFDADILKLIHQLAFEVITVVIDKQEHLSRYRVWQQNPYHYCLEALLERYIKTMRRKEAHGDVWAEQRGGKPDRQLEKCFEFLHKNGTGYVEKTDVQGCLTNCKIKLRPKTANVAGLQLADLLAHPSARHIQRQKLGSSRATAFEAKIVEQLVKTKYQRSPSGKIEGYGTKWLP